MRPPSDVVVLGAGIVGISVALHLQQAGRSVLLVDRREPGRETSYGNSGIIQSEGVRPRAFPRDIASLFAAARNRGVDVRYRWGALPGLAAPLFSYWRHSAPGRYETIVTAYAPLIAAAAGEHRAFIDAAGVADLVRTGGWLQMFRSARVRDDVFASVEAEYGSHGVGYELLDGAALAAAEPALRIAAAGAVRWTEPMTIADPGALVAAYADLFVRRGGTVARGDAMSLSSAGNGWRVATADGPADAAEAVVALGPWSAPLTRRLGYRLPLFVKRGYHMHYAPDAATPLRNWLLDSEPGYLLAPMRKGIRLTTGAEFAALDAPPSPVQLDAAEAVARSAVALGARLDPGPWLGARPSTPDMKPIIGPAPHHQGLWFAFGHAHHGFTLGPVTGRLLAERMSGTTPLVDLAPFSADRFG